MSEEQITDCPNYHFIYARPEPVDCSCGEGLAILEFKGLCERCWVDLTPEARAILQGKEPPVVEIRREIISPTETSIAIGAFVVLWRIVISAAVAALAYLKFRSL